MNISKSISVHRNKHLINFLEQNTSQLTQQKKNEKRKNFLPVYEPLFIYSFSKPPPKVFRYLISKGNFILFSLASRVMIWLYVMKIGYCSLYLLLSRESKKRLFMSSKTCNQNETFRQTKKNCIVWFCAVTFGSWLLYL